MLGEYFEDPEVTIEGRWRWLFPLAVLVALPLLGVYALRETEGEAFWPSQNSEMRGVDQQEHGVIGTSGLAVGVPGDHVFDSAPTGVIHDIDTITGQVDAHPLVGRKVDLHVPVAGSANDQAFWVGEKDNRLLVVPRRDHRDSVERQAGLLADHGIAPLESGKTAAISGSIQRIPNDEEMYSWGLTADDRREVARQGIYLRADTITVQ